MNGTNTHDLADHGLRAVLMDLDGTLYHQRPLRRRMLLELLLHPVLGGRPWAWPALLRRLRRFRAVREELRALGRPVEPLEELQYARPARELGESPEDVRASVEQWMYERPLPYLLPHRQEGLLEFLAGARARGLELGVYSDYPVRAKLHALGVEAPLSVELCATDPEINAFKPHPRGYERACELWGLAPEQVLYVGDRDEVDGAGARAAGMPCVIVGDAGEGGVRGLPELAERLGI